MTLPLWPTWEQWQTANVTAHMRVCHQPCTCTNCRMVNLGPKTFDELIWLVEHLLPDDAIPVVRADCFEQTWEDELKSRGYGVAFDYLCAGWIITTTPGRPAVAVDPPQVQKVVVPNRRCHRKV